MREILFRGKRAENDEWVFGDLRHIFYGECYPHIVDNSNGLNNSVCGLEVDPSTIGQFTGLIDRNGVKIFEGDIVRYGQRGKVEYNSGSAQFTLNFTNSAYEGFDKIPFCDCEVLGNIYDNPELLEVSKND